MEFRRYNNSIANQSQNSRRILESFYNGNSSKIRGMVVAENKYIIRYNEDNQRCTSFMHFYKEKNVFVFQR